MGKHVMVDGGAVYSSIEATFETRKRSRRGNPNTELGALGSFGAECIDLLRNEYAIEPVRWDGRGAKRYGVARRAEDDAKWSRPLNLDLMRWDSEGFLSAWERFTDALLASAGSGQLSGVKPDEVNRVLYQPVMSYAALVDLNGSGAAGTAFEMFCGPVVAVLTGRPELGDIALPTGPGLPPEVVKVDLHYPQPDRPLLCVPTKISTRERITQVYVHARILDVASGDAARTILCIVNETNAFKEKGRSGVEAVYVRDTLVPGTIALYQKYVQPIEGMYYLDPPEPYLQGSYAGLPRVATVGTLLTQDLPTLLK